MEYTRTNAPTAFYDIIDLVNIPMMMAPPQYRSVDLMEHHTMEYIINHVVLPPKLPQENDYSSKDDMWILHHVLKALQQFCNILRQDPADSTKLEATQRAIVMLNTFTSIHGGHGHDGEPTHIDEKALLNFLAKLCKNSGGSPQDITPIPLYVHSQNAGVLISRAGGNGDDDDDTIHFELFELLPHNHAVMSIAGRLQRTFPGCAIALPRKEVESSTFLRTLTDTLARMSRQPAYGTIPTVWKAGQEHEEDRDTKHPKMVTEMLAAYLRSVGDMVEVTSILKHTRQEILWENSRLPWHRSALWLLIRVTLQLFFSRSEGEVSGLDSYKNYMLLFMAYVLQEAQAHKISAELIWSIKAKITRRRLKLGALGYVGVISFVDDVLAGAEATLQERWTDIQAQDSIHHNFSTLRDLPAARDTEIRLERLDKFLQAISKRTYCTQSAKLHKSCPLPGFRSPLNESFEDFPSTTATIFKLLAFEDWVNHHLDEWLLEIHPNSERACRELRFVLESYHGCAVSQYQSNPEAMSTMLLTIMRLWVALDKSAISCCWLLADYKPCFSIAAMQKLILPARDQMEALLEIEEYFDNRFSESKFSADCIFRFTGDKNCFAVRYFDQSKEQQTLLSDIECRATDSKERKIIELEKQRDKYQKHMREYVVLECHCINRYSGGLYNIRSNQCERCKHKLDMDSLRIRLHEWPLPESKEEAKSVVFELRVPPSFGDWREATIYMLTEVLRCQYPPLEGGEGRCYTMKNIPDLAHFKVDDIERRIFLGSRAKPHSCTHRDIRSIITTPIEGICVNNGMKFGYYDNIRDRLVGDLVHTPNLQDSFLYRLSATSSPLQEFSTGRILPVLFSNTIIATQSQCPQNLSLEEYKAMAALQDGKKIKWQNLLKELASPSVDFRKEDTVLSVLQCIQEAGNPEPKNYLRETHSILGDERFSTALLNSLSDACDRISRNWHSAPALSAFISIASRVLSLSKSPSIHESCLAILSAARKTSISWVEMLRGKAQQATEDGIRDDFVSRSAFISLICADSFNIDISHLESVLSMPDQATIMIRAAIIVQESQQRLTAETHSLTALLYRRWRQLHLRTFPILAKVIVEGSPSLDQAIKASWATYHPVGQWLALEPPYQHWLRGCSKIDEYGNNFVVQFSTLTGELLVNGVPLDRLPQEYEQNPTYRILFDKSTMEIMPSSTKGMCFSGKQMFADHKLHFNLGTENMTLPETCLLVQASNEDSILEYIPPCLLRGFFPVAFVDDYVHWYNVTEGYVEFRPCNRVWLYSDQNWKLRRVDEDNAWQLNRGDKSLVKLGSTTADYLSQIFETLEDAPYIHISLDHNTSTLEIDLPRIQLGFSATLHDTSIKSHQHRGMSVHEHQGIGTLIGLQSKLVLKSNKVKQRDKVIIPNGNISYHGGKGHVRVTIDRSSSTKTQTYEIDQQLGRIVDNGTLTSKLRLLYLHGLTSFCLPDPLTGSTGTNTALTLLRSAAIRSFPGVSKEDVDLLTNIARLSPKREYYPSHLQEMMTVNWLSGPSFLAQHSQYYDSVKSVFKHLQRSKLFLPQDSAEFPTLDLYSVTETLHNRSKIHSAVVRAWDFGAECYTTNYDQVYLPRDRSQNSDTAVNALSLSATVFRCEPNSQGMVPYMENRLWRFVCNNCKIINSNSPSPPENFRYDATFLTESSKMISTDLLSIFKAFRSQDNKVDKHRVMIWLATLSFAEDSDMAILRTLALFFIDHALSAIEIPDIHLFDLSDGFERPIQPLKTGMWKFVRDFVDTPAPKLERIDSKTSQDRNRRYLQFQNRANHVLRNFIEGVVNQWPCKTPQIPPYAESSPWENFINVSKVMKHLERLFESISKNIRLRNYLEQVNCLTAPAAIALNTSVRMPKPANKPRYRAEGFVKSSDIVSGPAPLPGTSIEPRLPELKIKTKSTRDVSLLPHLLAQLDEVASSSFEVNYMTGLRDSQEALQKPDFVQHQEALQNSDFVQHQEAWRDVVNERYSAIVSAAKKAISKKLHIPDGRVGSTLATQHFPQICPTFLLQYLSRKKWCTLSDDWKRCLIRYGVALTQLQRANRLLDGVENPATLMKEFNNRGHENWDPYEYPESLLLEIENNILIRNVQQQIAAQMRDPPSGKNAIMQLNMGEGKSSVIVPIVAASLADTTRLVRVIVAKPQSKQMLQILVAKLGGLLDRQIYHLPFSRAIKFSDNSLQTIVQLIKECRESGGILLTQPENILSFMLMGIESCISGNSEGRNALISTLGTLDCYSRDIVDESDENFSVKFELLYAMGLQRPIQYSPERWIYVQHVLGIFKKVLPEMQKKFPGLIEIHPQPNGGFPRTRILRADVQDHVSTRIAEEICERGLRGFPIVRQQKEFRQAVFSYITEAQPSPTAVSMVEDNAPTGLWVNSRYTLLLLRGLLAGGVLGFCFGHKRWRVDYGLDASRKPKTRLALPFRAKDSPTPRSEFSHPEVVIVLTQLSYYYGGLSNSELDLAFRHLLKSDQADVEFQVWVQEASGLASEFRQLGCINLDDQSTCEEEIFPHFRYSLGTVNYFLTNIVFPKEIKEFPSKLSASGWDIGKTKAHPTTGFSGTNDSRAVLPLSVEQLDLAEQKHTNALVLENLLQPENTVALMPCHVNQELSDAKVLLNMVIHMNPPVRVILDVGAQILELDNLGVAKEWLSNTQTMEGTEAVVFFNLDDELSVLDRNGHVEPLQVSPYIDQLDLCLVFLDEAHTRGTELKLPRDYRAAVTLGANLTKDRLVQACMRMRLLGEGQSVVFCVPEEISFNIQQRFPRGRNDDVFTISVSDILAWAITETWTDAERNIRLWEAQGRRHQKHEDLWAQCRQSGYIMTKELAEKFLEDEAQSLEERYRPQQDRNETRQPDDAITQRCQQFNNLTVRSATLQEEQERELAPEIEQERQDERPRLAEPQKHHLHRDVLDFVRTGTINKSSNGYLDAFKSLEGTSVASLFNIAQFRPGLLVSADFATTIERRNSGDKLDSYQRPVQWILTGAASLQQSEITQMMVISPYEANELLPHVQESNHVALHLYAPRPNLGYRSLDKLDLYTIPLALKDRKIPHKFITELNLFAGQLYVGSFGEYVEICQFLGLAWEPAKDGEIIGADGFIHRDHAGRVGGESGLHASPVEFFKVFFTKIRRNCEAIDKTDMSQILNNQLLIPEDFERGAE
ncbi:hypothetical protein SAMD00023353_3901070 [Rosellinia necatrix]|uniref:ubiquitinyl hydrolase 1 n=1 Tax=Rosellinia necatrix TaxID=77044 RepID=A0A1S7UPJ8_ROSNE|nr:hypothetical protein SAMD00023353_3901070 [Rosellinia necatrix]